VEARQDDLRLRLTVRLGILLAAGNRLQALAGDRRGQHSMKLAMQNKGWKLAFHGPV
jgi:plasmid maintenance system killer protein